MASPQLVEAEINLEKAAIKLGKTNLKNNDRKLKEKEYYSASVVGVTSIDTLLPLVVEHLERTSARAKRGYNGVSFKEIRKYLNDVEPIAAGTIACKIIFDRVFSYKQNSNRITGICQAIGQAIEQEAQMIHYQKCAPGLMKSLKEKYWHNAIGTHQKFVVIRTMMNRCKVQPWQSWGTKTQIKLGVWLLDTVTQCSGWFMKNSVRVGKRTHLNLLPTPEFLDIKDKVMKEAELYAPLAFPMLVKPNDWTPTDDGGYLLNEVKRSHKFVRNGTPLPIQGKTVYDFVNTIQKTGFVLNSFTCETAQELEKLGRVVGKFVPAYEVVLPNKPYDIATNEIAKKRYCIDTAKALNEQNHVFRRSCRTRQILEMIKRFSYANGQVYPEFFLCWNLDYRGRAYSIPSLLHPQDSDFGKSLLKFSQPVHLDSNGEKWLKISLATAYGLDKSTMEERIDWVDSHEGYITDVATDPIRNLTMWEAAEEPWCFLALAEEYYRCCIKKDRKTTSIPCGIDATCSGIQILSTISKDHLAAKMVNVIPSDKPQDAYKAVADAARDDIPERLKPNWDRKIVKRAVMTICYAAKEWSRKAYIKQAFKEKGIEISKEELSQCTKAMTKAMNEVLPGPLQVLKWIDLEVGKAFKRGATELRWTTPSGFVVTQRLMKKKFVTMDLQLLGRCQLRVATGDTNQVDVAHHKNATCPNFIHSLDSSLLHLLIKRWGDKPIALIHDSVLCRATDMEQLAKNVRETYAEIFTSNDVLNDFAKQINAETPPPIIGDFNVKDVIKSKYFFC
tara:strand:- start:11700 stop:14057 length:2358 start_codon:yes stop_codon:yes gene_type:complete